MVAAARAWRKREADNADILYENFDDDRDSVDSMPLIDYLVSTVLSETSIEELEKHDSKFDRLETILNEVIGKNPKEKVIIFSFFRGTLWYLHERLSKLGIASQVLMGGMRETKQTIIDGFRERDDLRILLSSEVAAEGVDLQFCRMLVNYDLPWNPMRVEQRIGRIDRIGQQAETILIWNLCAAATIDEKILTRLYDRLKIFERALGGFEPILGAEIQELTSDLLSTPLTSEEEAARIEKAALAIANVRHQQEELEAEASKMVAHGGYVLQAVQAAHEFSRRITDRDLELYVRDYLLLHAAGHDFRQLSDSPPEFEIRLPANVAAKFSDFLKVKRLAAQTRLGTGESRRCRFVNKVQSRQGSVEQVSQFHPLVRFISVEVDATKHESSPVIAATLNRDHVSPQVESGSYGFVVKRWSFSGLRAEEELRGRVVHISTGRLLGADDSLNVINQARAWGKDWLDASAGVPAEEITESLDIAGDSVEEDFQNESRRRNNENADRIELQRYAVKQHRDRREARLKQTIQLHLSFGRHQLSKAVDGQLQKLSRKMDMQLENLEQKKNLARSQFDVCCGVINII